MPEYSLEALGLIDTPPEAAYDNLTQLAARLLDTPVSLVSIVETERKRQFFKSKLGIAEPWRSLRETPLSHSFCRHVVMGDETLVIDDARVHPKVCDNPSILVFGVVAYLGAPIRNPGGESIGALCVIDDKPRHWRPIDIENLEHLAGAVSDTIRLKAALNASETLRIEQRDFTYALSHDLRSPIDALRVLFGELTGEHGPCLDPEARQLVALGLGVADTAAALIEGVTRYTASVERGFEREPVALEGVLDAVTKRFSARIADTRAMLDIDTPSTVDGDPTQLYTLVEQLVDNALTYVHPGVAPRVRVTAHRTGRHVDLTVADEGIGIAAEHHARVFELFRRLHVQGDYSGSGLGLAICRRIASNHGGTIRLTSSGVQGAAFTVRLPAAA